MLFDAFQPREPDTSFHHRKGLCAPSLRPTGLPAEPVRRAFTIGGVSAAGAAYVVWGSVVQRSFEFLDLYLIPLVFVAATLLVAAITLVGPFFRALRVEIALDEGGLRCAVDEYVSYYPWVLLGPAQLEPDWRGIPTLTLTNESGRAFARVPLLGKSAHASAVTLLRSYEQRRAGRILPAPPVARSLARQGRPLSAWLEALAALGAASNKRAGYREQAPSDLAELPSIVADLGQTSEIRAAAAYVLLALRAPDLDALKNAITEAAPPLVQLLVHLSPAGKAIVSRESIEAVRPFLEPDEAAAIDGAG
ncbi:hypothetical protein [Polyangium jinanense]|uniref:Uncharacterized protein n=1 Tax=Polyangium jinanense TaxID=2829994 RepID=A0A9X4AYZ1_9BACT|nr:hypothetical protein [Polyangium jinanense]MDC3957702.1 hypothetical protein [Polyangium jinanense]MDC3987785.1 hypothetical protein [Polyangium jinanense]